MFSACSNDEKEAPQQNRELKQVELAFDCTIDSGMTRAGRPLNSSEALQKVSDMRIYAFQKNGSDYTYYTVGDDGYYAVPDFTDGADDATESHTFRVAAKLPAGDYMFLAIGYEDGAATVFTLPTFTGLTPDGVILKLQAGQFADEVFAGVSPSVAIVDNGGVKASVTLSRAVAGVLGYFTNIPVSANTPEGVAKDVKKVIVKAVKRGTEVNLGTHAATGANEEAAYDLLTIDLSAAANDGTIYTRPAVTTGTASSPSYKANSWLAGHFVMPVAPVVGTATLQVALCEADGTVIKSFNVVDSESGAPVKDFAMLADHFYGMGSKTSDGGDPGTDTPVDLSKDQEIVVTVKAEWDTIHDLDLE